MKTPLPPIHNSRETAYLIESYPYGRLRCKMLVWLETNKKGTRFVSQTQNPKNFVWNKPKASTYARFSGALYLDENGHVKWEGLTEYSDLAECRKYLETFGENCTNHAEVTSWTRKKEIFEEELSKFDPRPDYGSVLFKQAYSAAVQRFKTEA